MTKNSPDLPFGNKPNDSFSNYSLDLQFNRSHIHQTSKLSKLLEVNVVTQYRLTSSLTALRQCTVLLLATQVNNDQEKKQK